MNAFNNLSLRDRAIVIIGAFVVAYFALAMWWVVSQSATWSKAQKDYQRAAKERRDHENLIARRTQWINAYEEEAARLPSFPKEQKVDTHWMAAIDRIAKENYVTIGARQALENDETGDVCELAIDVKNYETSLQGLVGFIYALEHDTDGMFDVRELRIQPGGRNRAGVLKGNMRINCAYMRNKD